ncbi:protein CFT1 [Microthyrium microscopicum]|uniref:Protein CFT1 n=1 Tax=Microthyrium microscopicum TaxID=703497 RepID=A0A6A6UQ98_9PEZI|nr:protein CFT1 [Microthyrium microscopicum]
MQCYTEIAPPTAVSHAIVLPFLSARSNNLLVAKTSLLQIFELKTTTTQDEANSSEGLEPLPQDITAGTSNDQAFFSDVALQKLQSTSKLILVAEYPLSGTVASVARVKLIKSQSGGDALLVAFRDTKAALVEWDPERYSISTISIHYFENGLPYAPWAQDLNQCPCYLSVEPRNRCAIMRFGPRHIAIIPFRQPEDDADDDFDPDLDDPADRPIKDKTQTNGDLLTTHTPYGPSFVLSLTEMDPAIIFPVHMAFLHEYREPTCCVLYSSRAVSSAMTVERRDMLCYKVFTLDLEQQASTTILSVTRLPSDLWKIVPLPLPVGGALLLGYNEIVHVDQGGKTTAVAVNEFARQSSSFSMADQSSAGLRLEGCSIQPLGENGDMLIMLTSGDLAILSFSLDGRSVAGLGVHRVSTSQGGDIAPVGISCSSNLGRGKIFIGSEDNDSLVIGWSRKTTQIARKRSHADMLNDDSDISFDENDIEDDDDIYGGGATISRTTSRNAEPIIPSEIVFRVHDRLPNLCPTGDVTFGKLTSNNQAKTASSTISELQLVYPNGRGRSGALAVSGQEIDPVILQEVDMSSMKAVWTFHSKSSALRGLIPKGSKDTELLSPDSTFHQYLIVSETSDAESGGDSWLYTIDKGSLNKTQKGDFETEGSTVDIGNLAAGTRIVQVKTSEVRCYNSDFGLEQIIPVVDEETDADLTVIAVSFCDPYMLLLRGDSSITIFEATSSGDIEEMDRGKQLQERAWMSGCLYRPSSVDSKVYAFLMSSEGSLEVFELPNLNKPIYTTPAFQYLPGQIGDDFVKRRFAAKETLVEVLVADIGDVTTKSPHIILRTSEDDLVIYQPYYYPIPPKNSPFFHNIRWKKISQPNLSRVADIYGQEAKTAQKGSVLRRLQNIDGYSTVFQIGSARSFILKEASSLARVIKIRGHAINSMESFHTEECDRGFVSIDDMGTLRICRLQPGSRYGDTGWPTKRIRVNQEITHVAYLEKHDLYALTTTEKAEFKLPEDDNHKEWLNEDTEFLPVTDRGSVKLVHPGQWAIIDSYALDPNEIALTMTVANLETSEKTHERRSFVAVGSLVATGEDQAAAGRIHILDVVKVVPEPNRPETGFKLQSWAKEDVKGAATSIAQIGPQGFLLVAQGQKCLVRGLIEEQKLLPVAFMDIQCYVTTSKVLKGTGLFLLGDIAKGLWFSGYTEEPYKMILFGRSGSRMEVISSEFLPQDNQLNILAADADKNIHVFQYDPESAKSASGRLLIQKCTFHTGHFPVGMHLLPSTSLPNAPASSSPAPINFDEESEDEDQMSNGTGDNTPVPETNGTNGTTNGTNGTTNITAPPPVLPQQVLVVTQTGVLALITPVDELIYLRLNGLQTFLNAQLEHHCGLNPRGYRAVESERMGIKGVLDGTMLRRWTELPKQRRAEALSKLGTEEMVVRGDLERVAGGLGYL